MGDNGTHVEELDHVLFGGWERTDTEVKQHKRDQAEYVLQQT